MHVREICQMKTMPSCRRSAFFRQLGQIAILGISITACGKVEIDAPGTDAPTTDGPAADAPATDAPATDAPATDAAASGGVLVQQVIASTAHGTTISASLTSAATVGNLLVVFGASAGGPLDRVTGGGVASWMFATGSAIKANTEIWYGVVTTASQTPVVIAYDLGADLRLDLTEWSGLVASQDVLDLAASQSGASTPASTPAITTRAADLVIFGAAALDPTGTFHDPSGGPWTALTPITVSGAATQAAWYQIRPAAAPIQATVAVPGSSWDTSIAAFKLAP